MGNAYPLALWKSMAGHTRWQFKPHLALSSVCICLVSKWINEWYKQMTDDLLQIFDCLFTNSSDLYLEGIALQANFSMYPVFTIGE